MTAQTNPIYEFRHAWGFLVWDPEDGMVTRGSITLAQNATDTTGATLCHAGLVLAELASTATYAAVGTNTGNFTCGTITPGGAALEGVYSGVMTDATHFTLFAPPGAEGEAAVEVGHGVFGTAFNAGGLAFTITAGGTAAVDGDAFSITVAPAATPLYVAWDPTGATGAGSEVASAILGTNVVSTANGNVVAGALLRGPARINSSELLWGPNVTSSAQQAIALGQLASLGIQYTP